MLAGFFFNMEAVNYLSVSDKFVGNKFERPKVGPKGGAHGRSGTR